jgi:succinyl-CoA synthetase alpha subunit
MALLDSTGVLIQGITGREGRMTAAHMVAYGTPVVAGVTPGRDGETVSGVPVYDSVRAAVAALAERGERIGASVVIVPPFAVLEAATDALQHAGCDLVIATEGVPRHDALYVLAAARDVGRDIVGPNSTGLIQPGSRRKLGAIGGDRPERAFVPGAVGVVSRSGGMTAEIGLTLRQVGCGVSGAISIGGDDLIGLSPADAILRLQTVPETRAVCYFGEPGTAFEEALAEAISEGRVSLPVVALVAGSFTEHLPEGTAFGHAAAIIRSGIGRPSHKRRVLREAGATVVDSLDDMAEAVLEFLADGDE